MTLMSIQQHHTKRNFKPPFSDAFPLFTRDFDSYRREWYALREEEAATLSQAGRYRIAMQRTQIVESFPQCERPGILDRLNEPLFDVHSIFGEGNGHAEN